MLQKYNHPPPDTSEYSPRICPQIMVQHTSSLYQSPSYQLYQNSKKIIGSLLFYARAVDPTILPALNDLAADQSSPTILTDKAIDKLLDYCNTYPNPSILYKASKMVLHIDYDVSYLSLPQARSRTVGHYFLSDASSNSLLPPQTQPTPNSSIYILCKRMRNIFVPLLKLNLLRCSIMDKNQLSSAKPYWKGVILNHLHPSRLTTQLPMTLLIGLSFCVKHDQWTCVFIGFEIESPKEYSSSTGNLVRKILQIISPSITRQLTINVFVSTTLLIPPAPKRYTNRGCVTLLQTLPITKC